MNKFINIVEKLGKKLPHPIIIFCYLIVVVSFVSVFLNGYEFEEYKVNSIISKNGLIWFLENVIDNFIKYPVLGTVLVTTLGVGVAEETGFLKVLIKLIVMISKKEWVSYIVVFSGVLGNAAGSTSFVIIPPIGAMIFQARGRNPIAGIIAGFVGVAAGLSANLLITPTDVTSAGITQEAARLIDPNFIVNSTCNWYFMIASTFVITLVAGFMIENYVEKILDKQYKIEEFSLKQEVETLYISKSEKRALKKSLISIIFYFIIIFILLFNKILMDDSFVNSIFLKNIVPFATLLFFIPSYVFGKEIGKLQKFEDCIKMMTDSIKNLSSFILICFFCAQFVEIFKYTNLGLFVANKGVELIVNSKLNNIFLILMFMLLSTIINLFIGGLSAKWAMISPIFVPIFMKLKFSPYFIQAAFRIADSVTNPISPLEPFMPYIITLSRKYNKDVSLGTIIILIFPITVLLFISWTMLLFVFYYFNLPLGPGAYRFL